MVDICYGPKAVGSRGVIVEEQGPFEELLAHRTSTFRVLQTVVAFASLHICILGGSVPFFNICNANRTAMYVLPVGA